MSFSHDGRVIDGSLTRLKVGKPLLTTYSSFSGGVADSVIRARISQARNDWRITDEMKVTNYSFLRNRLRVNFDSATLEIIADGPIVEWRLTDTLPPLTEDYIDPYILIHIDLEHREELFDRAAILKVIVEQNIRYSPSRNELYLILRNSELEIGLYSLPLVEGDGYLLYYARNTGISEKEMKRE